MEQEFKLSEKAFEEYKADPSNIRKYFVLFFIGEVLLIISTLANATTINGVPRWIDLFSSLAVIANILFIFALTKLRKINKSFYYAFLTVIIYIISLIFEMVLGDTKDAFYTVIERGLTWSNTILFAIFYIYFFKGCYDVFHRYQREKGMRVSKVALIGTIALLLSHVIFAVLSKTGLVMVNRFFNRFFLYGDWLLSLISYVFHFVTILLVYLSAKKVIEELKEEHHENE